MLKSSIPRLTLVLLCLSASVFGCESRPPRSLVPDEGVAREAGSLDMIFLRVALSAPTFAGAVFDAEGVLHVRILGVPELEPSTRSTILEKLEALEILDKTGDSKKRVVFEEAKSEYSWFEILDYRAGMRDVLALPDVTYLDADESCGCVSVGIANESVRKSVDEFVARAGVPPKAVQTVIAPYYERYQAVTDTFRPMVGGTQIKNDAGPFAFIGFSDICTMTAVALRSGIAGIVTNSHCTRVQGGVEATSFYQNGRTPFSLDYVAHESADPPWTMSAGCPTGRLCRRSDSAFAVIDIGNQNGSLGVVARPTSLCTVGPCPTTMPSATSAIALTGLSAPPLVGAFVTKVGRTTGWTGGLVTATCIDTPQLGSVFTVLCQTAAALTSAGGDSGAPMLVVAGTPPTTGTLVGSMWGGSPGSTVFSPIGAVASELSVSFFPPSSSTSSPLPISPCIADCRLDRDRCMEDVAGSHGPRPQQCVADFNICKAECP